MKIFLSSFRKSMKIFVYSFKSLLNKFLLIVSWRLLRTFTRTLSFWIWDENFRFALCLFFITILKFSCSLFDYFSNNFWRFFLFLLICRSLIGESFAKLRWCLQHRVIWRVLMYCKLYIKLCHWAWWWKLRVVKINSNNFSSCLLTWTKCLF